MDAGQILQELFRPRGRVSIVTVRILIGLSLAMLLLAIGAYLSYSGGQRVAAVSAFGLISLGNLVQALGSILPEERGGVAARALVMPLAVLMFVALAVNLLFQLGIW